MRDNVPYEFPVSLPREDELDVVLRGTEESVHQGKIMFGSKG